MGPHEQAHSAGEAGFEDRLMDFDQAFERVIGHEGGYVNDPRDPGGETRYGISRRSSGSSGTASRSGLAMRAASRPRCIAAIWRWRASEVRRVTR